MIHLVIPTLIFYHTMIICIISGISGSNEHSGLAGASAVTSNSDSSQPSPTPNKTLDCESLRMGQYFCEDPIIDPETQQAYGCTEEHRTVPVECRPVSGIRCNGVVHNGETVGFTKKVPCKWTNDKKFSVALLLSVFLGWLGIDRFYLGFPAIGLLKFCTFGFMFVWHLVDMLLIAIQIIKPADGSEYVVDYYGAGLNRIENDNYTFIKPPDYG